MDKQTYIEQLKKALESKTTDVNVEKIIEYYEQYFDDDMDFGKSADEVAEELGNPEELAAEVLAGIQLKAVDLFTCEENVRMIDVALLDIRVHLVFSERSEVSVTYQGTDEYDPNLLNIEYKSNHLRILQRANRIMQWSNMKKNEQKPYLLIELPKTYKGKLMVKTRDSRIIVDGKYFETKVHFHLSSKNAKIECNELYCKDVEAISEHGRIKMSRCTMKMMDLENRTGRIEVEKCYANYIQAKSIDGRIMVTKSKIELAELENTDGRIIINESPIDDCRMQSEDGRISYELLEGNDGIHLDLLSRQGKVLVNNEKLPKGILAIKDIKPKKKEKRYLNIYARTSTGRIEITH